MRTLTPRIVGEILQHEGLAREAYRDSVGVWTWSVGITDASGHKVARYRDNPQTIERCLEVFVNSNPQSTLKLGQARGVCLLALARAGLPVAEYATRLVKKALVGTGRAEKAQVQAMLKVLLPGVKLAGADAADALAVAICHAHMRRD